MRIDEEQGIVRFTEITDLPTRGERVVLRWSPSSVVRLRSVLVEGADLVELQAGIYVLISLRADNERMQAWCAAPVVHPQQSVMITIRDGRGGTFVRRTGRLPFVVLEYDEFDAAIDSHVLGSARSGSEEMCDARERGGGLYDGYRCCRPAGHEGAHTVTNGTVDPPYSTVVYSWESER